jgi:hypothetical protein
MPEPTPPPSMYIMQPFNIPTSVNAPVRTGPRMNLTFPVFTPPAASSYGSTQPMAVPWTPPNLAGALNAGLETGGRLATQFMQNKKTAAEVQSEEQALKMAAAAAADPNRRGQMGFTMGPGGATATLPSPYELALTQANIAKSGAETEESRARTAGQYGQTAESAAKIAQEQEATRKSALETSLLGQNQFTLRHNQAANATKSGMITSDQNGQPSSQPDVTNQNLDVSQ